MSEQTKYRTERDSMGEFKVPSSAYYGANTMRAVLNFPISELRFSRSFIEAIASIKLAAAQTNMELGLLEDNLGEAIIKAATEVAAGDFDDQFVVDIFQTGSGTSTNMNVNEVISNPAIEILGGAIGSRKPVHPNDHVNIGQSSNDVIPTAIHLAAVGAIKNSLVPSLEKLEKSLSKKAEEFMPIIKTGRTHLQDATPVRLGQEFLGHAGQIQRGIERSNHALKELAEVALGGTAVGTGVNTHPEFATKVCKRLSRSLGVEIKETENHFQAQSTLDNVVESSGSMKTIAVSLMKISNDIRWMGSGPRPLTCTMVPYRRFGASSTRINALPSGHAAKTDMTGNRLAWSSRNTVSCRIILMTAGNDGSSLTPVNRGKVLLGIDFPRY